MTFENDSNLVYRSTWRPINKEEVVTKNGIVTAMQPPSAEAGLKMLKRGGNAIDAAVAIGFCNTVFEPFWASIAGQGIMLIYLADEDNTVAIDFNTRSPRNATPNMYKVTNVSHLYATLNIFDVENNENRIGANAVTVPSLVAGLCLAHELYGDLPLEKVIEPSIFFALNGFKTDGFLTLTCGNLFDRIIKNPLASKNWLPNGQPPKSYPPPVDIIIQKNLGKMLKRIAYEGPDFMYKGEVADAFVELVQKGGGVLVKEDLIEYKPRVVDPMDICYRDYNVMTVPAPIGGQTVLETLNIIENFDLTSLGHNTIEYLHLFIECARHAFADRFQYLGDWEVTTVPIKGLLSKKYAKEIAQQVDLDTAALEPELNEEPWVFYLDKKIHNPWKYDPHPSPKNYSNARATAYSDEMGNTTHLNAVDKKRNIVCCTHFGGFGNSSIIASLAANIPLPPKIHAYLDGGMGQLIPKAGYANSVEGWKHPLTNDSPCMVFKDGRPIMCVGAPGGRKIINRVTQVLLNVLEFGISIQDAIAMPTVDVATYETLISSRLPNNVISKLETMGHRIRIIDEEPGVSHFSRPSGLYIDYDSGLIHGGVDPFSPAIAIGY